MIFKVCLAPFLVLLFLLPTSEILAQAAIPEITPEMAAQYIGKTVSITGEVMEQKKSSYGNLFLNFGGSYPNQVFSACALSKVFTNGIPPCEGALVRVSGTVKIYMQKPSIVLQSPTHLQVIRPADSPQQNRSAHVR